MYLRCSSDLTELQIKHAHSWTSSRTKREETAPEDLFKIGVGPGNWATAHTPDVKCSLLCSTKRDSLYYAESIDSALPITLWTLLLSSALHVCPLSFPKSHLL